MSGKAVLFKIWVQLSVGGGCLRADEENQIVWGVSVWQSGLMRAVGMPGGWAKARCGCDEV